MCVVSSLRFSRGGPPPALQRSQDSAHFSPLTPPPPPFPSLSLEEFRNSRKKCMEKEDLDLIRINRADWKPFRRKTVTKTTESLLGHKSLLYSHCPPLLQSPFLSSPNPCFSFRPPWSPFYCNRYSLHFNPPASPPPPPPPLCTVGML